MHERPTNRRKLSLVLVSIFALICGEIVFAGAPLWGDLEPGPHPIGFTTVEEYDYSRVYRTKKDYFGAPLPGERSRPIQVCIWYPAEISESRPAMVYGEYAFPYPSDESFRDLVTNMQGREVQLLQGYTRADRGFILDLFSKEMAAVRDAVPAAGPFPLIIYHPNIESNYNHNVVLCEYLASYGFVVATTHPLGISELTPRFSQAGIETVIRDGEFVMASARQLPQVDERKLGLLGFGSGGSTSLLMQMRNTDVDAIADLGGSLVFGDILDTIRNNPYYSEEKADVPLMVLHTDAEFSPDMSLVDSLKYSDRHICRMSNLGYMDFCTIGDIIRLVPDSTGAARNEADWGHEAVCQYTMRFFKAYLDGDEESLQYLSNSPSDNGWDAELLSTDRLLAQKTPPSERQFIQIIMDYGAFRAGEVYEEFQQSHPGAIAFDERVMNYLGYQQLQSNQPDQAMVLFRLNAEAHPNSANCWDSYADGCMATGDTEEAIRCYRKVLEVLPDDPNANDGLKATLRQNAEEGLKRLQR